LHNITGHVSLKTKQDNQRASTKNLKTDSTTGTKIMNSLNNTGHKIGMTTDMYATVFQGHEDHNRKKPIVNAAVKAVTSLPCLTIDGLWSIARRE
jgi:hypothetical protein